jgi:nucleotide-binding universal stress UspA family protein
MDSTRPVVAGVDGSTTSERALSWAAHAAAQRGMPFEIVHAWQMPVLGELPDPVVLDPIPYERDAREVLDGAVAHIRQLMPVLLVQPRLVRGEAAGALLEAASTASVLVLGSHGRGWIGSALVGSVSQQCVTHVPIPVVVVPAHGDAAIEQGRIVVGVDGSDGSYGALHFAVEEATRRRARLDVVHVWHQPEPMGPLATQLWAYRASAEKASEALLEAMSAPLPSGSVSRPGPAAIEQISIEGRPSQALVSCAQGADLLVVGARGRGGFTGLLLGSVSLRCVHNTPCPIAVVHAASS